MITREDLLRGIRFNTQRAKAAVEGLTHEDALLQPPVPGNCMNWVLGHMVSSRHEALETLGQPALMTEAQAKRYGYGSDRSARTARGSCVWRRSSRSSSAARRPWRAGSRR